jgi:molybdenum cofactor guanylyltransferase
MNTKGTGIILAGGNSRRMGENKALMEINGEKNIERIFKKVKEVTSEVVIITNEPVLYEFLNTNIVEDMIKDKGPLAGIHAGILSSSTEYNFITACDLPFFNERIAAYFLSLTNEHNSDVIIPFIEGRFHPLFAVYRSSILPVVEECLSQDKLRIFDLLEKLNVYKVTEKELESLGMSKQEITDAFFNMNRPEDYNYVINKLAAT